MIVGALPIVCAEEFGDATVSGPSGSDDTPSFLVDYGNGKTEWISGAVSGTSSAVAVNLLNSAGIETTYTDVSGLIVDGISAKTVGSDQTGGSLADPGTTGVTVAVSWHFFRWNGSAWGEVYPASRSDQPLAVAYYPDGTAPVVSPVHRSAWTMIGVDANNTFNTTVTMDPETATPLFECFPGSDDTSGVYSSLLYAKGHILVKYGWTTSAHKALVACYSQATGELEWKFYMPNCMLETTTSLIVGDYLFIQTMGRVVYRVNYLEGPGEPDQDGNYPNVISMEGKAMKNITDDDKMPLETIEVIGKGYGYGMGSMIYSDGLILGKAHNGMFYAFDTDLHLVWSYQTTGSNFFSSVSCVDGMVFGGTLDGYLYVLDVKDGSLIAKEQVKESTKKTSIQPMTPIIFREGANYRIFLTWSTTQMGSSNNGYAVYVFDPSAKTFENIVKVDQKGGVSNNMTAYSIDGKPATLLSTSEGVCSLASDGTLTVVLSYFKESYTTHAPFTLVNGNDLYLSTYQMGQDRENAQSIYLIHMDAPEKRYRYTSSTLQYAMAAVTVVDGLIMCGNDAGAYALKGSIDSGTHTVTFSGIGFAVTVDGAIINSGDLIRQGQTIKLQAKTEKQIEYASYNDGTEHDITDRLSFIMPDADVTLTVIVSQGPVIIFVGAGFTVTADGEIIKSGQSVYKGAVIRITADSGRTITKATYNDGTEHDITSILMFTMPDTSVTLTVVMQEDPVIVFVGTGFTVTADGYVIKSGQKVYGGATIMITADSGRSIIKATYNDGTEHDITSNPKFTMPDGPVALTVETKSTSGGGNIVTYAAIGAIASVAAVGAVAALMFVRRP